MPNKIRQNYHFDDQTEYNSRSFRYKDLTGILHYYTFQVDNPYYYDLAHSRNKVLWLPVANDGAAKAQSVKDADNSKTSVPIFFPRSEIPELRMSATENRFSARELQEVSVLRDSSGSLYVPSS